MRRTPQYCAAGDAFQNTACHVGRDEDTVAHDEETTARSFAHRTIFVQQDRPAGALAFRFRAGHAAIQVIGRRFYAGGLAFSALRRQLLTTNCLPVLKSVTRGRGRQNRTADRSGC